MSTHVGALATPNPHCCPPAVESEQRPDESLLSKVGATASELRAAELYILSLRAASAASPQPIAQTTVTPAPAPAPISLAPVPITPAPAAPAAAPATPDCFPHEPELGSGLPQLGSPSMTPPPHPQGTQRTMDTPSAFEAQRRWWPKAIEPNTLRIDPVSSAPNATACPAPLHPTISPAPFLCSNSR